MHSRHSRLLDEASSLTNFRVQFYRAHDSPSLHRSTRVPITTLIQPVIGSELERTFLPSSNQTAFLSPYSCSALAVPTLAASRGAAQSTLRAPRSTRSAHSKLLSLAESSGSWPNLPFVSFVLWYSVDATSSAAASGDLRATTFVGTCPQIGKAALMGESRTEISAQVFF